MANAPLELLVLGLEAFALIWNPKDTEEERTEKLVTQCNGNTLAQSRTELALEIQHLPGLFGGSEPLLAIVLCRSNKDRDFNVDQIPFT